MRPGKQTMAVRRRTTRCFSIIFNYFLNDGPRALPSSLMYASYGLQSRSLLHCRSLRVALSRSLYRASSAFLPLYPNFLNIVNISLFNSFQTRIICISYLLKKYNNLFLFSYLFRHLNVIFI